MDVYSWTCRKCGEVITAENEIELALDVTYHFTGC